MGAYKITKKAESDNVVDGTEGRIGFLSNLVQQRLGFLQAVLQSNLQNISNPIREERYLETIREELDASYENQKEAASMANREVVAVTELGTVAEQTRRKVINMSLDLGSQQNEINLNEFISNENTNRFDPYVIQINSSPLFREPQLFEYCDTIPGPGLNESTLTSEQAENRQMFEDAISNIPQGIYTRQELLARKCWENVKRRVDSIYQNVDLNNDDRVAINDYLNPNSFLRRYIYNNEGTRFVEGIFEQIFFSLRRSRIYDQQGYYQELKARVAGDFYINEDDSNPCYKNRYNISSLGILSFEKIVTDEISNQVSREMAKSENDPYNRDYDDLDPIQKAIQNVCMIGFVRMCIVELLLKGSLAYSVWDMESVADEPFMKDFVFRFVHQEIKRHESFKGIWEEVISRITGIDQASYALKDLVSKQLIKIQGASKRIFQNQQDIDYYNWFINYFVPQTEVSRTIANRDEAGIVNIQRGQRLDRDGNILEEAQLIQDIPDKFYWQHPLVDQGNLIAQEDGYASLRDPIQTARNTLNSNHPFFHIEHLIEVWGPLARLESLILPSFEIMNSFIRADRTDLSPDNLPLLTFVESRDRRDLDYLNIVSAYRRVSMPPIELQDYDLIQTPVLQESSRLSSAEEPNQLNSEHEIYHIDDFVGSLSRAVNRDNFEKIMLHYRGLMHYDPNNGNPPGSAYRNTPYSAANARPEVIRRTPTRFITVTRRIIKFSHDFVSHNQEDFHNNPLRDTIYSGNFYGPAGNDYFQNGVPSQGSQEDYENLVQNVSSPAEETANYYIVTSNGEELLQLRQLYEQSGQRIDIVMDDSRFNSYISRDNAIQTGESLVATNSFQTEEAAQMTGEMRMIFDAEGNPRAVDGVRQNFIQAGLSAPTRRGLQKALNIEGLTLNEDVLTHKRTNNAAPEEIFRNIYGKVDSFEGFEEIKSSFENPNEERWIETVFEFSGPGSLLVGLYGSFSIGETMDKAVANFRPDGNLMRTFSSLLRSTIDSLHGENTYANARSGLNEDSGLTQYGRNFFLKPIVRAGEDADFDVGWLDANEGANQIIDDEVYIARPMGIDRDTNLITAPWLSDGESYIQASFTPKEELEGIELPFLKQNSKKNVIYHNPDESLRGILPRDEDYVPPNFYKMPMRVLVTQVYSGLATTPREVYCKVVPPKYIKNIHNEQELENNIQALNESLRLIADQYVSFIDTIVDDPTISGLPRHGEENADFYTLEALRARMPGLSKLPQFSTDFTRAHEERRNTPNLTYDTTEQYCSIERIYSDIFHAETNPFNPNSQWNSPEELDELFRTRGKLLVNRRRPQLVAAPFSNNMQYAESCNQFYVADTDIVNNPSPTNFHNIIFSLKNVFQWYLRSRTKDSLWGTLTAPVNSPIDGPAPDYQRLPLAQSYWFSRTAGRPDLLQRGRAMYYNDYQRWATMALPNKSFHDWADGSQGDFRVITRDIENQPGFVTLYPGDSDVDSVHEEGFNPALFSGTGAIIKADLLEWTFYGDDAATLGLYSDGVGSQKVNYNSVEISPIKKYGTSMFYCGGALSHMDICNFFRVCMSRLLIDSMVDQSSPYLRHDCYRYFNVSEFNSRQRNNAILLGLAGGYDTGTSFDFGYNIFTPINGFGSAADFTLDENRVHELITFCIHMTTRMYYLASSQASFCVKSEVTERNQDILRGPYRLAIVLEALRKIQVDNLEPEQKLLILAAISDYEFADNLLQRRRDSLVQSSDFETVPDEELVDWAATCLFFLALVHVNGHLVLPGEEYDTNMANLYSIRRSYGAAGRHRTFTKLDNFEDRLQTRDLGTAARRAQLFKIGGTPLGGQTAQQCFNEVKDLVLNQRENVNMSVKEIIKKTNNVYHQVQQRTQGAFGVNAPSGQPGDSYRNNVHILNVLLSDYYSSTPIVRQMGNLWQRSLSRANAAVLGGNPIRSLINNPAQQDAYTSEYMNQAFSEDLQSIRYGTIEDCIIKLDERHFRHIFSTGEHGLDAVNNPLANDASFVTRYMHDIFREKAINETVGEYYTALIERVFCSSRAFAPAKVQLAFQTLLFHPNNVDNITSRWNRQYSAYTGLTAQLFNGQAFNRALQASGNRILSGLFRDSKIEQKVRLIANMQVRSGAEQEDTVRFNNLISNIDGPMQVASEEYRTFYMFSDDQSQIFSSPLADYSKTISDFGEGVDACYDLNTFREDYKRLQPWMTQQLLESDDGRQVFQYMFPVKRYQAVITAFATSALAGYSSMPQIMQTPKASLAALMGIASINTKESLQIFENFSQAELYKKLTDANASDQSLDCFGFPFNSDFLKQMEDLLKELFLQFPSIFFRGIANVVDPAYKEMRSHYMNCNIDKLTMGGLRWSKTAHRRNMSAGISHNAPLDGTGGGEYSSVITAPFVDIPYGVGKAFFGNWKPLGRALERMTGYIIKGPIALIDGSFSLTIPCKGVDSEWPDPNREPWNADRYGHPLSPFTILALSTPELIGDKMLRQCSPLQDIDSEQVCDDSEPSPFGEMPDPEE